MAPHKQIEHEVGIWQQFHCDPSQCDFDEMLDKGSDKNIQGRYADIEELGSDIKFSHKVVFHSSSTYESGATRIPQEESIPKTHKDTNSKKAEENLLSLKE